MAKTRVVALVGSLVARALDESKLVANAKIAGASPLHDWIGEGAAVFSY